MQVKVKSCDTATMLDDGSIGKYLITDCPFYNRVMGEAICLVSKTSTEGHYGEGTRPDNCPLLAEDTVTVVNWS